MNKNPHNYFIISTLDFTQKSAAATRMLYYAKALADDRNQVYLTSCCSTKLSNNCFVEIEPNVFVLDKMNITTNFLKIFFFLGRLNMFAKSKGGDKTYLLYPTAFVFLEILTVFYLKLYWNNKVFYELNEVRKYSSAYEAPISFKSISYSLKKIIFKFLFTFTQPLLAIYDGLICISTQIENYGRRFNKNTLRVPILTNPNITLMASENKYFTEGKFNIGFSGSINAIKEDLENFIAVVEKLKTKGYSISFNLCGSIFKTYKNNFLTQCDLKEELKYYGFLNELELSTFLSQQDLLVLPRGYTPQNHYGFSTKLSDYLNHQKMVLVTDVGDNKLYIKDGINGFVVPPNNKNAMLEKIEYVIKNYDRIKSTIVVNAHKTSNTQFDFRIYSVKLRNFLKKSDSN